MKKPVSLLLLSLFLNLLLGCSVNEKDRIIGLWQVVPKFPFCDEDFTNSGVPDALNRSVINRATLDFTNQGKIITKFKVHRDVMQTQEINEEQFYEYIIEKNTIEVTNDRKVNKYGISFVDDTLVLKLVIDDKLKAKLKEYAEYNGRDGLEEEMLACKERKTYKFIRIK